MAICLLLEGQADIQADGIAARLLCAPVGSLHDAGPAARADDEAAAVGIVSSVQFL